MIYFTLRTSDFTIFSIFTFDRTQGWVCPTIAFPLIEGCNDLQHVEDEKLISLYEPAVSVTVVVKSFLPPTFTNIYTLQFYH